MGPIVWAGVFHLLLAWVFARRRSIRRWWRTKACPHPDCVGRLPAEPLHTGYAGYHKEQCEVCQNWVQWDTSRIPIAGYNRVKADK